MRWFSRTRRLKSSTRASGSCTSSRCGGKALGRCPCRAKSSQRVVPIDNAVQISVAEILGRFPTLVDSRKNTSQADPFVIALARIQGRTVVTGEKAASNGKVPKIPNVCAHYHVPTCNLLQMCRELGWRFGR